MKPFLPLSPPVAWMEANGPFQALYPRHPRAVGEVGTDGPEKRVQLKKGTMLLSWLLAILSWWLMGSIRLFANDPAQQTVSLSLRGPIGSFCQIRIVGASQHELRLQVPQSGRQPKETQDVAILNVSPGGRYQFKIRHGDARKPAFSETEIFRFPSVPAGESSWMVLTPPSSLDIFVGFPPQVRQSAEPLGGGQVQFSTTVTPAKITTERKIPLKAVNLREFGAYRTWTDAAGKQVNAALLQVLPDAVVIANTKGMVFTVPLNRLGQDDRHVVDGLPRSPFLEEADAVEGKFPTVVQ